MVMMDDATCKSVSLPVQRTLSIFQLLQLSGLIHCPICDWTVPDYYDMPHNMPNAALHLSDVLTTWL